MHQHNRRSARQPFLLNLAWASALLLFPLEYIISYPVVLRSNAVGPVAHTSGYQPAKWLPDETPLWHPIHWWSEICGSEQELGGGWLMRNILGTGPMRSDPP